MITSGNAQLYDEASVSDSALQPSVDASAGVANGTAGPEDSSASDSAEDLVASERGLTKKESALVDQLKSGPAGEMPVGIAVNEELLEMARRPDDLDIPENHRDIYFFKEIRGSAYVKGKGDAEDVDPNDVKQGFLGDCYLHAALLAIARARPALIRRMIREREDGTFDVELYFKNSVFSLSRSPHVVNVRPTFPTKSDGSPAYAGTGDSGSQGPELWVMLIEKAWAIRHGGYHKISDSSPSKVFDAMTADETTKSSLLLLDFAYEPVLRAIDRALKAKRPVTAETKKPSPGANADEMARLKIAPNHAYAPSFVDTGLWLIDLTNPHGDKTTYPDIVRLHGESFLRLFWRVTEMPEASPPPQAPPTMIGPFP